MLCSGVWFVMIIRVVRIRIGDLVSFFDELCNVAFSKNKNSIGSKCVRKFELFIRYK